MKGFLLGAGLLAALPLVSGEILEGRVMNGGVPLAGVRVYPDRGVRVRPSSFPPIAWTDSEGRFHLDLEADDQVVVFEKEGMQREMRPRAALSKDVVLRLAPSHRVEKVLLVRLEFPDQPANRSDDELRALLFARQPGVASVANYVYEVSKGSLELEEGAVLRLQDHAHPLPRSDEQRRSMLDAVLAQLKDLDLSDFDRVDNRTGALKPDGQPDHLWIVPPGPPRTVTTNPEHLSAISYLLPLPWDRRTRWGLVFFTEETPLGNIVHEAMHAMGEHRADDLYRGCEDPDTAGIWDVMDAGQYRGWDALRPKEGPWQEQVGYSPSQPMGWVRAELWYRGRFRETVRTLRLKTRMWTGWLAPLASAPAGDPQRLVIPDPRRKGRFWECSVRRPWGFDRGRTAGRFGPGYEGLVVARIAPDLLSTDGDSRGPVRVIDAHPQTPEPPQPRFPCERWQLDDAAFNRGEGEVEAGKDGPLSWRILETDEQGRMKVRVRLVDTAFQPGKSPDKAKR